MARRFFVNGFASDAAQCSGSVGTAIADSAMAVPFAATKRDSGSAVAPTAATRGVRKDGLIIAIANGNTGADARA